jgi:hypothetical protein
VADVDAQYLNINLTYVMVKNLSDIFARVNFYLTQGKTLSFDAVRAPEASD